MWVLPWRGGHVSFIAYLFIHLCPNGSAVVSVLCANKLFEVGNWSHECIIGKTDSHVLSFLELVMFYDEKQTSVHLPIMCVLP